VAIVFLVTSQIRGAGAKGYKDSPPVGGPYTYTVEAFNGVGASGATAVDAGCIF